MATTTDRVPAHGARGRTGARALTAVAVAATAVMATTAPAFASDTWRPTRADAQTNATLEVRGDALLRDDGAAVAWMVRFTCPSGQPYTLVTAVLGDEDATPTPGARSTTTGTCTGHMQVLRLVLPTVSTVPLVPTTLGMSWAYLTGDGFEAGNCIGGACASATGQGGNLRLH